MGRAYFPIGKLKAALACVYFGFLTISILPHSGGFFNTFCERYYLCIKTRYTLSYLRAHRIGPDRLYDPGRFFPRSGRFTPIAPPEIFHPKPEVHLWFFSWGFLSAGTLYFRVPAGDPGSPIRPAPSVRMGAAVRGRRGPSLPAVPSLPHLRKTRFCTPCFASCKGATPYKTSCFAQVRGPALGWVGRSLPLPMDSRGGYPPAPPLRPEQGRARCVPVGRRAASPLFGFATSPALRSFSAPRPGRLRPAAGSATAPPSIWCGACAPEAVEPSARPPSRR